MERLFSFIQFSYTRRAFSARLSKYPRGGRSYVHQQIPADAYGVDQHLNEHFGGFPCAFVAIISPRSRKSLAGFPNYEFSRFGMFQPGHGLVLFGRPDILFDFGAVVNDNVGADTARRFDQFFRFPGVFPCIQGLAEAGFCVYEKSNQRMSIFP